MKKSISTLVVLTLVVVMASPVMAQRHKKPEPPEGWFGLAHQNALNVVPSITARHDASKCSNYGDCFDWNQRVWSGQIDRLWYQAAKTEFYTRGRGIGWGNYNGNYGYMGYGNGGYWFRNGDTGTKILLGATIAISAWNLIANHRRGNKQKEVVQENTAAVNEQTAAINRQAGIEAELLTALQHQNQEAGTGTPAVPNTAGSVVNATGSHGGPGCDIIVREKNGRQVEVPHGQSRFLTDVEGFTAKTPAGYCPGGIAVEYTQGRQVGVVSCES